VQIERLPGHTALPNGASHLSMLPLMRQKAMNGHEQQTDAIPVLLGSVGTARTESHGEREQDETRSIREAAGRAGR
jgi:hypothetical protein